jgi:hypothetical protein
MSDNNHTKATMLGGTLTIFLANLATTDLVTTAILAAVGAVVSFIISQILKLVVKKWTKEKPQASDS